MTAAAEAVMDAARTLAEVARGTAWGGTPGTAPAAVRYMLAAYDAARDAVSAAYDAEYDKATEAEVADARAWSAHYAAAARDALGRALAIHAEAYGHDVTTARLAEAVRLAEVARTAAEVMP